MIVMSIDNKTVLIIGLEIAGLFSLYLGMENIASAIFGGLVGYLSKDVPQAVYDRLTGDKDGIEDEP